MERTTIFFVLFMAVVFFVSAISCFLAMIKEVRETIKRLPEPEGIVLHFVWTKLNKGNPSPPPSIEERREYLLSLLGSGKDGEKPYKTTQDEQKNESPSWEVTYKS